MKQRFKITLQYTEGNSLPNTQRSGISNPGRREKWRWLLVSSSGVCRSCIGVL